MVLLKTNWIPSAAEIPVFIDECCDWAAHIVRNVSRSYRRAADYSTVKNLFLKGTYA